MNLFEFNSVGRIVFGIDQVNRLAELARPLGSRALLVTNAGQVGDGGAIDRVRSLLTAGGLLCEVVRKRGEPTVEDIDRGVSVARLANCDLVIGLGGGSAIDAAKAQGRIVLVKYTASWCGSCLWLEATVYSDRQVADELANLNVLAVKGDVTNAGPARAMLYDQLHGAPPLTVIYPPGGRPPVFLSGEFSKDRLIEALREAAKVRNLAL